MQLVGTIRSKRNNWLIKKAVELENELKDVTKEASTRKLFYDDNRLTFLKFIEYFTGKELKKGLEVSDVFLKNKILEKLANLESNYRQETVENVREVQRIKNKLTSIYRFKGIKKSVNGLLNEDTIGTAYDTVVEAYIQKKIGKEKFKQIRKDVESKLNRQVHYSDVIVQDLLGRVLLLKRADGDDELAGKWCLPGGHVDPEESHQDAAARELREEALIDVDSSSLIKVAELDSNTAFIEYYRADVYYIPVIVINIREHQDYEWVNVYDLPKYDLIYDLQNVFKKIFKFELSRDIIEIKKSFNAILLAYLNGKLDEQVVGNTVKVYFDKSKEKGDPEKVGVVMQEFKEGRLRSSSGEKVTSRDQAIAIALNYAGVNNDSKDLGKSFKYIRKDPDGKGGYRYTYTERKGDSASYDKNKDRQIEEQKKEQERIKREDKEIRGLLDKYNIEYEGNISTSSTDWGISHYFYVKNGLTGEKVKVRVSDHEVTNPYRLENEEILNGIKEENFKRLEFLVHPERFELKEIKDRPPKVGDVQRNGKFYEKIHKSNGIDIGLGEVVGLGGEMGNGSEFEKVNDDAERIIRGEGYLKRLSPAEEQGRIRGGKTNVIATILCAGVEESNSTGNRRIRTKGERFKVKERQKDILKRYAQDSGVWFSFDRLFNVNNLVFSGVGYSIYYYNDNYVQKVINLDVIDHTPLEYLDNISLHNYLFPEAPIELTGFTEVNGIFTFVVRQPIIKDIQPTLYEEIEDELIKMGFAEDDDVFINENYIVEGLSPTNVLKTKGGNLVFVNPLVSLNLEDGGMDGVRRYGKVAEEL